MKKIFAFALCGLLLISIAACSQLPDNIPSINGAITELPALDEHLPTISTATDDNNAVGGWGDTEFERLFVGEVNGLGFISKIVGVQEMDDYINEFVEPVKWEKRYTPAVYDAIIYFDISEEIFRQYNSMVIEFNEQNGTEGVTYTEEEIDALYCGDEAEMIDQLRRPYTFFDGNAVYSAYELVQMDANELIEANIPLNELSEYCDWVFDEISEYNDGTDFYVDVDWYEEHFNTLRSEIAAAGARAPSQLPIVE